MPSPASLNQYANRLIEFFEPGDELTEAYITFEALVLSDVPIELAFEFVVQAKL